MIRFVTMLLMIVIIGALLVHEIVSKWLAKHVYLYLFLPLISIFSPLLQQPLPAFIFHCFLLRVCKEQGEMMIMMLRDFYKPKSEVVFS